MPVSSATSTPSRARRRAGAQEVPPAVVAGRASRSWILPLLVFALTVVPFLPSLDGRFLNWDDDKLLLNNPEFRGLGWAQLRDGAGTHHSSPVVRAALAQALSGRAEELAREGRTHDAETLRKEASALGAGR